MMPSGIAGTASARSFPIGPLLPLVISYGPALSVRSPRDPLNSRILPRLANLRPDSRTEGPPSSVEQRGARRGAGRRPGSEAATVVHREHAQYGGNRGEDDDAGLMG